MIKNPGIAINTEVINHANEFFEPVELGYVIESLLNKREITIVYDPHCFIKDGYHLFTSKGESTYYIVMDNLHFPLFNKDPDVLEALLLHEVGHISNGDYANPPMKADEVKANRMQLIMQGKVQPHELAADRYAAKHVGVTVMLRALDYLISVRKKRENDPGKSIAIREFELRKKALLESK